jgi:hypothetical protein
VLLGALLAALGALWAPPATAQPGDAAVELYGGYYFPDPGIIDHSFTLGLRGAVPIRERINLQVGFGYAGSEGDVTLDDGTHVAFDYTLTFMDLTLAYEYRVRRRVWLAFEGGPSWSFVDADLDARLGHEEETLRGVRDDTFSLHFGAGAKYFVRRAWYLRPVVRFRWQEQRESEGLDSELSLALGYTLGR